MKFIAPPEPVGYYQIGGPLGLQIHLMRRPYWLHRTMMRVLLGWEWFDGTPWLRPSGGKHS